MTLNLTIDLRAVLIGFVLLLVAAGVATPFAISLADDGPPAAAPSSAIGTGFTYQGRIEQDGVPKDGSVSLQFQLWVLSRFRKTSFGGLEDRRKIRGREYFFPKPCTHAPRPANTHWLPNPL